MFALLRSHPYRTGGALAVVLTGLAWLAFGFFGVHTLLLDDVVSEAAPVFEAPTTPAVAASSAVVPPTDASDRIEVAVESPTDSLLDDGGADRFVSDAPAQIVTERSGDFVGDAHPTSGRAIVLGNGTGQRFLRFESFETDNGPDLNVYLVNGSTGDVSDFVDLGDLKGNIGEQNYEIPTDIDLDRYDTVVVWCVRFGVAFGNASLVAA